MKLNFIDNDYVTNILVFAKKDIDSGYYFCNKEIWILEWWDYNSLLGTTIEEQQFEYIQKFKINLGQLRRHAVELVKDDRFNELRNNLPCIYVDFDEKLFFSTFYDQSLERRLIDGWTGRFRSFLDLIPWQYKFWIIDQKDYSDSTKDVQ